MMRDAALANRDREARYRTLEDTIQRLTKQYTTQPSPALRRSLKQARMAHNNLYTTQAEYALQRLRHRHYEQGEKAGRLLAAQLRQRDAASAIPAIMSPSGAVLTRPQDIVNEFATYYQHLYTPETTTDQAQTEAFLIAAKLPCLSEAGRALLEGDISKEEITQVVNPLWKNIFYKMYNDTSVKTQCLQYLKTLRRLQFDGHQTIFFGESNIPESLITGETRPLRENLRYPTWSIVHAGGSQGWVPWRYRLFLTDELPMSPREDIFHELCASLTESYGKCAIVVKEMKQPLGTKDQPDNVSKGNELSKAIILHLSNIKCTPQVAKEYGHELLSMPLAYSYLSPLDSAWSTLKWFIVNNRRQFSLMSTQMIGSYQYILLRDLIGSGVDKMTPARWRALTNKVRRWENHYLNKYS
ncbi:uncharacterized protein C21orf140 homolog [Pleurodeles waltl]|uniref:uncharacterized protein C21orf140 homolog n=1 Tax=Pleurodeles waltl TaxID=8319 RepID=UPI0037095BC8